MLVRVDGRELNIRFSAAHFIPSHDKCSRLHGHDYTVSADIEGMEKKGFVVDYLVVEKILRDITEPMDHRVILPINSTDLRIENDGNLITVEYSGKKIMVDRGDVYKIEKESSSSENIASYLLEKLTENLRSFPNIIRVSLCVYEGPGRVACASK